MLHDGMVHRLSHRQQASLSMTHIEALIRAGTRSTLANQTGFMKESHTCILPEYVTPVARV